jgi:hypothetical protein
MDNRTTVAFQTGRNDVREMNLQRRSARLGGFLGTPEETFLQVTYGQQT